MRPPSESSGVFARAAIVVASVPKALGAVLISALVTLRERRELALLAALVVLAAMAWAFTEIADEVLEGDGRAAEERILLAFRVPGDPGEPIGPVVVQEAMRDLTALGGALPTALATLFWTGFLLLDGRPRYAAFLVGSIASGVVVTFVLKSGFERVRPDVVAHQMEALSSSFPSGHAATSALVYLTLGAIIAQSMPRKRLQVYAVAAAAMLSFGVGISRLYLGVHWPTDVLAGWTVGAGWALAAWLLARHFRHRGWIEPYRIS